MEKKAVGKEIRNDGYQPRHPMAGYKPEKPDTKPNPPTTDTNVTTDKK